MKLRRALLLLGPIIAICYVYDVKIRYQACGLAHLLESVQKILMFVAFQTGEREAASHKSGALFHADCVDFQLYYHVKTTAR